MLRKDTALAVAMERLLNADVTTGRTVNVNEI